MQTQTVSKLALILVTISLAGQAPGAGLQIQHHFIECSLPVTDKLVGDYGLTALVDLDRDGHLDFVLGGRPFGDGKPDVVMMGDERTKLNCLCWYSVPSDPRQPWTRHLIGPPVHGAITPNGVADLDGDGDLDVIRADTWFENKDGKGREWVVHQNIPMGRKGPYGVCVRTAVVDIDGDGQQEIVMADADITGSKVVVLKNVDGKGGSWIKTELSQSFTYGSLHALAVADFNGDGKPDIVVIEQEELLPSGRENPRWVIWQNLGSGRFAERIILDAKLGGHELQVGDVDGDGDVDICSKPWGPRSWNGRGGKMHVDFLENRLKSSNAASK